MPFKNRSPIQDLENLGHQIVNCQLPRCGHCKKLAPEYASAAASLAEAGSPVKLAKVMIFVMVMMMVVVMMMVMMCNVRAICVLGKVWI